MPLQVLQGNLFSSAAQTIVNTVNCHGAMGRGLALEFRFRFPELYTQYQKRCSKGLMRIGEPWLYKQSRPWVLNFPTKHHWRFPSRPQYLHQGLTFFMQNYEGMEIQSIAFPLLGASHGGIDGKVSRKIMEEYLSHCSIPVEIILPQPGLTDPVFERFRDAFQTFDREILKKKAKVPWSRIHSIQRALQKKNIFQFQQLLSCPGVGEKTLGKILSLFLHLADPAKDSHLDSELSKKDGFVQGELF
jgi:O-acetyl-ADP-ribose deacetylase (regulator of RNase III)